jgi:hypothetical protein
MEAEEDLGVVDTASRDVDEEVAGFERDNEYTQKSPLLSECGGGVFETRVTRRSVIEGMGQNL